MKIFNSYTQAKENFTVLKKNEVSLYVCGITPYDTTHLGHAFTYIIFDVLQRYLTYKGYSIKYTQNITDLDDDILHKAKQTNQNWRELGNGWTNKFVNDLKALNILMPTHYVKATDSISRMIEMISSLLAKKAAYQRNGNIYFDITTFPEYGNLSKFTHMQMLQLTKERGGNPDDPYKKNHLDFLLWQTSQVGEPYWQSPWGKGRPGWHIECSAMVNEYLGDQIDIHGGGRDLIFPHHESEIAQSERFTGKHPYVRYWMHTAMVMYQGEKMAKSLGNLIMIADLLKIYSPNAVRWMLLSHHYRIPWEFTKDEMDKAQEKVQVIETIVKKSKLTTIEHSKDFDDNMNDDLNVPVVLDKLIILMNENKEAEIKHIWNILGFTIDR